MKLRTDNALVTIGYYQLTVGSLLAQMNDISPGFTYLLSQILIEDVNVFEINVTQRKLDGRPGVDCSLAIDSLLTYH